MNENNTNQCKCQCGQVTSVKANYRPGHDARHVSNLLALCAIDIHHIGHIQPSTTNAALQALPSPSLKSKYLAAAERLELRATTRTGRIVRTDRTEWVDCDTDEYKVGRWTYPVQVKMYREGIRGLKPGQESEVLDYRRNTKRDGSGEWIALEGGELTNR